MKPNNFFLFYFYWTNARGKNGADLAFLDDFANPILKVKFKV